MDLELNLVGVTSLFQVYEISCCILWSKYCGKPLAEDLAQRWKQQYIVDIIS